MQGLDSQKPYNCPYGFVCLGMVSKSITLCLLMMMAILDENFLLKSGTEWKWKKIILLLAQCLLNKIISSEVTQFPSDSCSRLGVNVSFVLNISTGLVLPQYNLRHDNFFEITHNSNRNISMPSTWQFLVELGRSNGGNSLEIDDMVHQWIWSTVRDDVLSSNI